MTADPATSASAAAPAVPASATAPRLRAWIDSLAVYRDRRVLSMLFLGFSSGLPFGALAEPLSAWLTESAVDLAVGAAGHSARSYC